MKNYRNKNIVVGLITLLVLSGCAGSRAIIDFSLVTADGTECTTHVETMRRVAVTQQGCDAASAISGQVLISDETVQVLAPVVSKAINPIDLPN